MNITKNALINALAAIVYIAVVATVINYVPKFLGDKNGLLGSIAFLLIFVVSAAVMGLTIFGRPILWYLDGFKKEAVRLAFYTIGFLACALIIVFAILAAMR